MSIKKCAREGCGKTVYQIEELKCLDKVFLKNKIIKKLKF